MGSDSQGQQTVKMLAGKEEVWLKISPNVVLVEGEKKVLAGTVAAVNLEIKVGHIEAGFRSYDRNMSE